MAERLNNTIETQINDGNTIVSQITDNNQPLQTVIQDIPQVQTVLQNGINVSSQINAPFVEVTSVNGKTGDVITEPVVGVFEPNHYYLKNTMIGHNNNLYYAKETFTSGSSFNANDWYSVEGSQITVDSALSSTSENPVQNKVITNALNGKNKTIYTAYNVAPAEDTTAEWRTLLGGQGVYITWYNTTKTFTNQPVQYGFMRTIIGANDIRQDFWVQTSGVHYARTGNYQGWSSYAGTTGIFKNLGAQPGNGTLTIQRNGTNVQTFTANQTGNATANISVPTKTSDITNDSGFITGIPTASASTLGGIKVGDGLDITSTGTLSTKLQFVDGPSAEDIDWSLVINKIYPVGSIYISTTLDTVAKVKAAFGGTWIAWGSGRVPIGVDSSQTEFNSVEKTGGNKTHTHGLTNGYAKLVLKGNGQVRYQERSVAAWTDNYYVPSAGSGGGGSDSQGYATNLDGSTNAGSSLQPYITCYMYKRTA